MATSATLQPDGQLVVAGYVTIGGYRALTLARYSQSSTDNNAYVLDTTFGSDGSGTVVTPLADSDVTAQSVGIDSEGRIVVAGEKDDDAIVLVRYDGSGNLDSTFGDNASGMAAKSYTGDEVTVGGIAIDSSDRILVAATIATDAADSTLALLRYNTDGTLDTNFNSSGITTADFDTNKTDACGIALQSDGKILVAATVQEGTESDFALARFTTTGSLDTDFGSEGKIVTTFSGAATAGGLAVLSNGKIMVAGNLENNSTAGIAIACYQPGVVGVPITVNEVAPTIDLSSNALTVNEGATYTLTLGPVTEWGTHTITGYVIHWGDGTADTYQPAGSTSPITHQFQFGDTITIISVDVIDDDGTHPNAGSRVVSVVGPPTVTTAATATLDTAAETADLSVTASDLPGNGGEANLTYKWAVADMPSWANEPTFTFASGVENGDNAAQDAKITFTTAGNYYLTVKITNAMTGLSTTSSVLVTVDQTLTSVSLDPSTTAFPTMQSVSDGSSVDFTQSTDTHTLAVQDTSSTGDASAVIGYGDPGLGGDYVVSSTITFNTLNELGLVARGDAENGAGYVLTFDPTSCTLSIVEWTSPTDSQVLAEQSIENLTVATNESFQLKFDVYGDELTGYLSSAAGTPLGSVSVYDDTFGTGMVGTWARKIGATAIAGTWSILQVSPEIAPPRRSSLRRPLTTSSAMRCTRSRRSPGPPPRPPRAWGHRFERFVHRLQHRLLGLCDDHGRRCQLQCQHHAGGGRSRRRWPPPPRPPTVRSRAPRRRSPSRATMMRAQQVCSTPGRSPRNPTEPRTRPSAPTAPTPLKIRRSPSAVRARTSSWWRSPMRQGFRPSPPP